MHLTFTPCHSLVVPMPSIVASGWLMYEKYGAKKMMMAM